MHRAVSTPGDRRKRRFPADRPGACHELDDVRSHRLRRGVVGDSRSSWTLNDGGWMGGVGDEYSVGGQDTCYNNLAWVGEGGGEK